jgi:hypothetical protein
MGKSDTVHDYLFSLLSLRKDSCERVSLMFGVTKICIVSVLLVLVAVLGLARCASRKVGIHQGENLMASKTIERYLKTTQIN